MLDLISNPARPARVVRYLTTDDVLRFASYFNQVAGGRGWSRAVMEENLPGWSLSDLVALCVRRRLIGRGEPGSWRWLQPDVVGLVIDGETVVVDRGDLQHPAKSAAWRRVDIGHTGRHVRHLRGDESPIIVHVRASATTPDERQLHEVARSAYLASASRPSLVLNAGNSLVDPFDPPHAGFAVAGAPLDEWTDAYVRSYNADLVRLLRCERARHGRVVLVTLGVHDDSMPLEATRADLTHLPPELRSDARGIVSRVVSLRVDTLSGAGRPDAVAALAALVGDGRSVGQWMRAK